MKKNSDNEHAKDSIDDYDFKTALTDRRQHISVSYDCGRLPDQIYLTAVGCDEMLKKLPLFTFDLEVLKTKFMRLAIKDTRAESMFKITSSALRTTINTCFRRGYIVSPTGYQWIAAACSIIPFLDELPAYFERDKISEAFGVHDNSMETNTLNNTATSIKKDFTVPKTYLISNCFKYLCCNKEKQSVANIPNNLNESLRLTEPRNSKDTIARPQNVTASLGHGACNVVGRLLTPVFALWSMNEHLHVLCDDLLAIAAYFLATIYNSHINMTLSPEIVSFEEALLETDENSSGEE
ncbi:unnamed protein product [Rotaria magnacalcarata]|uniref:Uncharacterized protein n=1 Tax=Rotaria magnacalcarata TaxID=392030 RepID=A0A820GIL5_9BILA|nr:unnamed protein product [Rotaria magnacalcarata]